MSVFLICITEIEAPCSRVKVEEAVKDALITVPNSINNKVEREAVIIHGISAIKRKLEEPDVIDRTKIKVLA